MRRLAYLTCAFSVGIFLAQYLLPYDGLLPCMAAAFVLACGALLLPGLWRGRVLLIGVGLALALGHDWLYVRQVQRPMEALAETEQAVVMTLRDYAASHSSHFLVRASGISFSVCFWAL